MDKFVLSLIFAVLGGFTAHAESGSPTTILPVDGAVEIWSFSKSGQVESPDLKITNVTDACTVNANEIGQQEWIALSAFNDENQKPKIVQITSALFHNCRIIFGRVRSLDERDLQKNDTPAVLLGNVNSNAAAQIEVKYEGASTREILTKFAEQLRASPRPSSQDTSLVLMSVPKR